jgi:uncharacterized protein YndB with AHSA1/START domain
MPETLIARNAIRIDAPAPKVWAALVTPAAIKRYMFGTTVVTDWKEGGPIAWKGEWQGRAYEDKGVIRRIVPERLLQYTHFSSLSGLPDRPENYHTVTIELQADGAGTQVALAQDNNRTEKEREHSQKNWAMMLEALRKYVEGGGA